MALSSIKYYHRDLSWLRFNHRVLQEAMDKKNPLYERIKFLAIFSSNLDEFFKVRVSDIRKIKNLDKKLRKKLITKPNKLLKKIKKEVDQQQDQFGAIFRNQIIPDLQDEGIFLIQQNDFSETQESFSRKFYDTTINKNIKLQSITSAKDELFIDNEQLYLIGINNKGHLLSVKIPSDMDRFVVLPMTAGKHYITFIDDVIKNFLNKEYNTKFYSLKISRDAELYIENEYSGNLLDKIKNSLGNRETGQATRVLLDKDAPDTLVSKLKKALDVNDTDMISGGTYHNFKDFFAFPNPLKKKLSFSELPPIKNQALNKFASWFTAIQEKDRLFYFPYESFNSVLDFVKEAAQDPQVTQIKITLYRVAEESGIAEALLKALKNGKEVFVFIETKARFDEENNMKWGSVLEQNGANVLYSYPGIKVHSKIMYIARKENGEDKGYAYISTGNFNEKTARIYTDYGLVTCKKEITLELLQVFKVLEGKMIIPRTRHLLISPFTTRKNFEKLVSTEIEYAQQGKEAYITLKMNSLQDTAMIDLLYKANNAGVKIQLLIRGICCLIAGIEGQSEHIKITSIVDRFLEHGRVFIFGNNGDEKIFIGSADWMSRNLDHRIEVVVPILDKDIAKKINETLQLQLDDTCKARIIDQEQLNNYVAQNSKTENIGSQEKIYQYIANSDE